MEFRQRFVDTVSYKDKKEIWDLYFNKFYSYDELEFRFKGKYSYAQLKDIIRERIRNYNGDTK